MDGLKLFNATLVTDRGLIIEDVEAKEVGEVLPFLEKKFGLKEVTHFVISLGEKIELNKKKTLC